MKLWHQLKVRPWGLLSAVGLVGLIGTLATFAGDWWWVMDVGANFRVQYMVVLSLIAAMLAAGRQFRAALVAGAGASLNLAVIIPVYFGGPATPAANATVLRMASINVNSSNQRYESVKRFVDSANLDLIVFQEVNASWLRELDDLRTRYPYVVAHPGWTCSGIAMFSRLPLSNGEIGFWGEAGLPSVLARINIHGRELTVLGSHPMPPGSSESTRLRDEQFTALGRKLLEVQGPVVLLADLNCTPWSRRFRELLDAAHLKNSANGWGIQPTWPSWPYFSKLLGIPIDHCLVSKEIGITNREVGPDIGSDHFPLVVGLDLSHAAVTAARSRDH